MATMLIFLIFLVSLTTTLVYSRPQPTSKSTVVDIQVPQPTSKSTVVDIIPSGSDTRLLVVVGLSGGVVAACLICLVCFCVWRLKRKVCHAHAHASDDELINIIIDGVKVMPFQDLNKATNNFSNNNILGKGGSGTVYKGDLEDGTKVAVKRTENKGGLDDEFKTEIAVSTVVRHSHLVALRGYYFDAKERLLVYEYMPQGTLSRFLFDWERQGLKPLDWTQRLIIALDVARGVEYMHCLGQQSFIHRDLKPSNILLDNDMRAKVADFGLARPASDSSVTHRAGSFGYFAPEYAEMGTVSTKIDVYSFGVILAELITGRRAIIAVDGEERVLLVKWLLRMYKDAVTFRQAVDPALDLDEEEALDGVIMAVAELAAHCCASRPNKRPNMSQVVTVLSDLADPWKPSEAEGVEHYTDTDTGSSFSSLDGWSEPETEPEGVEHYTDVDSDSFSSLDG